MASKRIKGITIEIGAETTGLDKALKGVNDSARDIQKELREVERSLKFNPKNTELLAQKQKLLGDQVSTTREKLEKLKSAEKQVQDQFKKGEIKEDQYRAFQRELIETESKLNHYEKTLKDATKTQDSWKDKLDATAQSLKKTGDKMKGIGKGFTAGVTGPIAAAGTGLFALATKSGEAADRLLDLKEITGLTTDSLQEWGHVADVAGVDSEAMANAVEGLVRKMPGLKKESGPATEALQEMGLSFEQLENMSPDAQFDTLINYLSEMEDPLKRNALGSQLFGGAWKDLAPVLSLGADGIKKTREEAHELGRVMSEDSLNDANDFRIEMDKLKGVFGDTANQIGADLAPMLRDTLAPLVKDTIVPALKDMGDAVKRGVEWYGNLSPTMQRTIPKIAAVAAAIGPVLMVFGTLAGAVGNIIALFGGGAVAGAASAVGGGLTAAFGAISLPIVGAVAAVAGLIAIGVALYKNWDKIMEWGAKLKESISEAWDGVKSKTSDTWEGIKEKTSEAWNSVKDKTTEMWTSVKDSIGDKVDSAKKKVSDTWSDVRNKTSETWGAIKDKTSETWGAIKGKIDENGGGIKGLIVTYAEAYETAWDTGLGLLESATGIKFTAIKDSISEKLEDMKRAIKEAVRKFIDLFDFEWSLPKPKVPKFSISGKFSLDPPSIPKIGIDWNAEGAIFTKPYVFGNQGFGEAGPEAVLPIEKLSGILANTLDKMETRSNNAIRYEHAGVIRVEGVNNQGQMVGVVDMVMDQLRREARGR